MYVHIPFCKQACTYCDFHFSTSLKSKEEIIGSIIREIEFRSQTWEYKTLKSVYFGGGTPSLLNPEELGKIVECIDSNFNLNQLTEFTLEANPDDIREDSINSWKKLGVNRLSIGIQSFNPAVLRWMNRAHTREEGIRSINRALEAGFETSSIDLIYGYPSLTDSNWNMELRMALQSGIKHISAYNLTVEHKTVLSHRITKGLDAPLCDEDGSRHLSIFQEELDKHGWEHYEISNACKPGYRSVHNCSYWSRQAYMGVGPSAHSFDGKQRRWNVASNYKYMNQMKAGEPYWNSEELTARERINEYLMLGLRTTDGIDLNQLVADEGYNLLEEQADKLSEMKGNGWLVQDNKSIRLTTFGMRFADHIASTLFLL